MRFTTSEMLPRTLRRGRLLSGGAVMSAAALLVCLCTSPALADYAYMNKVYQFVDGGEYLPVVVGTFPDTVRAHPGANWEVYHPWWTNSTGMNHITGPYGGTWDGFYIGSGVGNPIPDTTQPWVQFGYPYSRLAQNGTAYATDEEWIAAHIFSDPDDATYPNDPLGALNDVNDGVYGVAKSSFLSLPGQNGNNSYVIVGIVDGTASKALDPNGPGADLSIVGMYDASEQANIWVSTNTLDIEDPLFTPDDWTFILAATISQAQNDIDLAGLGLTEAVQAIMIEGIDMLGTSAGFDLSGVVYSTDSLVDPGPLGIPEPASMLLLAVGGAALFCFRGRRNRR